jgi:4'-phosphopantetheinyl transferase
VTVHRKIAGRSCNLAGRTIQVWAVVTEAPDSIVAELEELLSPDEKIRASRFRFDRHRRSFVIARGTLRILLGRYLDRAPAGIQFECGAKGKPAVAPRNELEFNVSHSGGLATFAFTLGCQIGIDLEKIRPLPDMEPIARRFFNTDEAAEIMSLHPKERDRAFFLCWTRKEAYIKATGDGLSAPLDDFRVTLRPCELPRFVHISHDEAAAGAWTLHDLQFAPDYAGALAYRGSERDLSVMPILDPAEYAAHR